MNILNINFEENLPKKENENENKELNEKEKKLLSSSQDIQNLIVSDKSTQDSLTFSLNHFNKEGNNVTNVQNSSINEDARSQIPLTKRAILSALSDKKTALMIQNILLVSNKETTDTIINELRGNYRNLIKDKNGNYFCSDLFKICDQNQRIKILKELSKTFYEDCTDKYATHSLQTLIDYSTCEEEYKLILNSFNDPTKLYYVSFDSYGNYVIQKIIEHIPEKFRRQFNLLFLLSTPSLTLKQYGLNCCKKFIEFTKTEELIASLITIIKKDFVKIATHNFGNFLIQEMLKKYNNTENGKNLKREIIDNFRILSTNKYSSYIVDLFLKIASSEEKNQVIAIHNLNNINLYQNFNNQNPLLLNNINLGLPNYGEMQNNNTNNNQISSFINNINHMNSINNINNMNNISNICNISNINNMNNLNNYNHNKNMMNNKKVVNPNDLPLSLHNFRKK